MHRAFFCLLMSLSAAAQAWPPHQSLSTTAPSMRPVNDMALGAEPPAAGTPVSPETEKKVRTFLDRFVDADKSPAEQAALFTEEAEYYEQGVVGKNAIRRDVERYVKHWPHRSYQVSEISYINPDPMSKDRVFVAYTIDFEVANRARTIRGKANYGAVINNLSDEPKVEAIKERVTRRKSGAAE
ncbi:hypothetical protein [Noviherbaspirillum sp.]|uniref:hypothetical protein n=1 Tax=Noviherbaspirillum sp. TaxID=1926288 RepID=UPI002FE32101